MFIVNYSSTNYSINMQETRGTPELDLISPLVKYVKWTS